MSSTTNYPYITFLTTDTPRVIITSDSIYSYLTAYPQQRYVRRSIILENRNNNESMVNLKIDIAIKSDKSSSLEKKVFAANAIQELLKFSCTDSYAYNSAYLSEINELESKNEYYYLVPLSLSAFEKKSISLNYVVYPYESYGDASGNRKDKYIFQLNTEMNDSMINIEYNTKKFENTYYYISSVDYDSNNTIIMRLYKVIYNFSKMPNEIKSSGNISTIKWNVNKVDITEETEFIEWMRLNSDSTIYNQFSVKLNDMNELLLNKSLYSKFNSSILSSLFTITDNTYLDYITDPIKRKLYSNLVQFCINNIYAGQGNKFKDRKLAEYYNNFPWYATTDKVLLSKEELENLEKLMYIRQLLRR